MGVPYTSRVLGARKQIHEDSSLEPMEEDEGSKCHRQVHFSSVQSMLELDEVGVLGTHKRMRDEVSTEASSVFMAIVRVRF